MEIKILRPPKLYTLLDYGPDSLKQWLIDYPDSLIDFEGHVFDESWKWSFENIEFSNLNFKNAIFKRNVEFKDCVFTKGLFLNGVVLNNAIVGFMGECVFEQELRMHNCRTEDVGDIEKSSMLFTNSKFNKNVAIKSAHGMSFKFNCVEVEDDFSISESKKIDFFRAYDCKFHGEFKAFGSTSPQIFQGVVGLAKSKFFKDLDFDNVELRGPFLIDSEVDGNLNLMGCKFLNKTLPPHFSRSKVSDNIDLTSSEFSIVPDFRFSEIGGSVIYLDTKVDCLRVDPKDLEVELKSLSQMQGFHMISDVVKALHEKYDHLRFSRLKELAGNNSDYEKMFFIDELKSKRRYEHKNVLLVFNYFYDYFGGSGFHVHRPLAAVFFVWVTFAYFFHVYVYFGSQFEGFAWQSWYGSLQFSASNLIPFLGAAKDMHQESKHILFLSDCSDSFPQFLYVFTLIENIFGVALGFLFGLALRTRFRIR